MLEDATTCAVLAPAGPHKMLCLKQLYNDERTKNISNRYMLEQMYNEMVIKKEV